MENVFCKYDKHIKVAHSGYDGARSTSERGALNHVPSQIDEVPSQIAGVPAK